MVIRRVGFLLSGILLATCSAVADTDLGAISERQTSVIAVSHSVSPAKIHRAASAAPSRLIDRCAVQDSSLVLYGCQLYSQDVNEAAFEQVSLRGGLSKDGVRGPLSVEVVLSW